MIARKPIVLAAAAAILLAGIFGCGGASAAPAESPSAVSTVRVAAWNMKWFPAGHPVATPVDRSVKDEWRRADSAARFIRWQRADVVLLEEMRDMEACEMLCTNAALQGWSVDALTRFETAPDAAVPAHQNAIVSRFASVDSGWRTWKGRGGVVPPRGFVWAVYDFGGTLCAVVGVHLKSNFIPQDAENAEALPAINRRMREVSALELSDFADELRGRDFDGRHVAEIIVAGDFNTSVFDEKYAGEETIPTMLKAGFRDCFEGVVERDTMPESKWYPATCFDYMFAKGPATFFAPSVAPKSWTSDHQMISASFEF